MQGDALSMKKTLLICLLLALLLTGCGRASRSAPEPAPVMTAAPTPALTPTPEPTPEPTPDNMAAVNAALNEIGSMIDAGRCYEAFRDLVALEEKYSTDEAARSKCEEQFAQLDKRLKAQEPESGTELSRTFAVQGGGVLAIDAFSGPVLVTVTDAYAVLEGNPNPPAVTFYVRQGEVGETNLPAGTYHVAYQVGYRWFGAEDGFGEYCTVGELPEPMVFEFYMDGQWASTSKFKITL